jgi:hypothetical protein
MALISKATDCGQKRTARYAKNQKDEFFIQELNDNLLDLERKLLNQHGEISPHIFIFGLPRSGTTVVYQALARALSIAWPTNLMARFWRVPCVGMRLSRMLKLFDLELDFVSDYGVTTGLHGPHEFGYFWLQNLNYRDARLRDASHEDTINWNSLVSTLDAISAQAQRPVVYKNMIYAFHLRRMQECFPKSLWIYCQRDLIEVGASILLARKERFGSADAWWSIQPPDVGRVLSFPPEKQIAYQVLWFNNYWEKMLKELKPINMFTIRYEKLNEDLDKVIPATAQAAQLSHISSIPRLTPTSYAGTMEYETLRSAMDGKINPEDVFS